MAPHSASRRQFALSLGAALGVTVVRPSASAAAPAGPAAPTVIDLSSNENPYGPSPAALEA
jgi:histidinol-phosphate/aromatic aminotransferase/cobyric acid decarboxylase-like protein